MEKVFIVIFVLMFTSSASAVSQKQKEEAIKALSNKRNIEVSELDEVIKLDAKRKAIDDIIAQITADIIQNKIDEAKRYQPTEEEIITELKKIKKDLVVNP